MKYSNRKEKFSLINVYLEELIARNALYYVLYAFLECFIKNSSHL